VLTSTADVEAPDIVLAAGTRPPTTGRITDQRGNPIAGARVQVARTPPNLVVSGVRHIHWDETDARGAFAMIAAGQGAAEVRVPHDPWLVPIHLFLGERLAVRADGKVAAPSIVISQEPMRQLMEIGDGVTLVVRDGGTISGTVFANGAPASRARVAARSLDRTFYDAHTISDAAGHYELGPLPAGRVAVFATTDTRRLERLMNGRGEPGAVELVLEARRRQDGVDLEAFPAAR
jgi:hypothetical protein